MSNYSFKGNAMLDHYREEPQVMVIDDISATRTILKDMLIEMGFKDIVEAKNGKDALEKLRKHRAQLIICDNMMDGMSGLDLLYQLRNHAYLVDIPFIVVSSCGDVPVIDTALDLGAEDYILKPISFKLFKRKVFDVLRRRLVGAA
jgi:two-component system chemotaxis response regulator CheY